MSIVGDHIHLENIYVGEMWFIMAREQCQVDEAGSNLSNSQKGQKEAEKPRDSDHYVDDVHCSISQYSIVDSEVHRPIAIFGPLGNSSPECLG